MDLPRNKLEIICQIKMLKFYSFYIKDDNNLIASKTVIGKVSI